MSKNFTYIDGFKVYEGHAELDLPVKQNTRKGKFANDGKIDNAHEDSAFSLSPEFKNATAPQDFREDFESLCDSAQG